MAKEAIFRLGICQLILILSEGTVNTLTQELSIHEYYQFTSHVTNPLNEAISFISARVTTSISTAVAIVTSFLDSQFTFCSMQRSRPPKKSLHEPVSDIEYILPRVRQYYIYSLHEN
jgi:recombination DNA repair RAD52 pathway protein